MASPLLLVELALFSTVILTAQQVGFLHLSSPSWLQSSVQEEEEGNRASARFRNSDPQNFTMTFNSPERGGGGSRSPPPPLRDRPLSPHAPGAEALWSRSPPRPSDQTAPTADRRSGDRCRPPMPVRTAPEEATPILCDNYMLREFFFHCFIFIVLLFVFVCIIFSI